MNIYKKLILLLSVVICLFSCNNNASEDSKNRVNKTNIVADTINKEDKISEDIEIDILQSSIEFYKFSISFYKFLLESIISL